jgi:hypothetical protein
MVGRVADVGVARHQQRGRRADEDHHTSDTYNPSQGDLSGRHHRSGTRLSNTARMG